MRYFFSLPTLTNPVHHPLFPWFNLHDGKMTHNENWTALPKVMWWIIRLQNLTRQTDTYANTFFSPHAQTHTQMEIFSIYFWEYWSTTWQNLRESFWHEACWLPALLLKVIKALDNSFTCSLAQQSVITSDLCIGCYVCLTEEEVAVYTKNVLPVNYNRCLLVL